jgi:hypothetical protein
MILPTNDGHRVKRVNYATEVNNEKANRKESDHPEATHHGVPGRSTVFSNAEMSLKRVCIKP